MSKTTLQNWLHEKTGPSVPTQPWRPQFKLLRFAATATAASIDALPIPGTVTSFMAEIEVQGPHYRFNLRDENF